MFETLRRKPTNLDKAIDNLADMIDDSSLTPDDMDAMIGQLERLAKVKSAIQPPSNLSSDAKLTAAAHILGIAMIVGHERAHVVTSKAIGFVQKLTT